VCRADDEMLVLSLTESRPPSCRHADGWHPTECPPVPGARSACEIATTAAAIACSSALVRGSRSRMAVDEPRFAVAEGSRRHDASAPRPAFQIYWECVICSARPPHFGALSNHATSFCRTTGRGRHCHSGFTIPRSFT
jgi:hypothetical protein